MLTPLQSRVAEEILQYSQGGDYWCVSPETGAYLYHLIRKNYCRFGVECGSGIGYSTLWMAAAFRQTRGKLIAFEFFLPKWEKAIEFMKKARLSSHVELILASAHKGIPHLPKEVDFAFLDARKCDYLEHFRLIKNRAKKGAIVVADNVTTHAAELTAYLEYVRGNFQSEFQDIGSGLEITRI